MHFLDNTFLVKLGTLNMKLIIQNFQLYTRVIKHYIQHCYVTFISLILLSNNVLTLGHYPYLYSISSYQGIVHWELALFVNSPILTSYGEE